MTREELLLPTARSHPPHRTFAAAMVVIALVALALRLVVALTVADDLAIPGDAKYFRTTGASLAAGDGYTEVHQPGGQRLPSATHPPLFPVVLATADIVGIRSPTTQRVLMAVVSTAGVVLLGLAGRRLAGTFVGLAAAAIAAVHPLWVQPPVILMSEGLSLVLVPAVLLLAVGAFDRPTIGRMFAVGLVIGLAALTRSEALGFVALLGIPLAVLSGGPAVRRAVLALALVAGTSVAVGPWLIRNVVAFDRPVLSTNLGGTLTGSNCPQTYHGEALGGFELVCSYGAGATFLFDPPPEPEGMWTPERIDAELRAVAIDNISADRGRLPVVAAARLGRSLGVFALSDTLDMDIGEGRHPGLQRLGMGFHLLLLPLTAAGVVLVVRRGEWRRWLGVLASGLLVCLVAIAFYGGTRMRAGAEPAIALLSAYALVAALRRWRTDWRPRVRLPA